MAAINTVKEFIFRKSDFTKANVKQDRFELRLDQVRSLLRSVVRDGVYREDFQYEPILDPFQSEHITNILMDLDNFISQYYGLVEG